jgi:hypothetical protein
MNSGIEVFSQIQKTCFSTVLHLHPALYRAVLPSFFNELIFHDLILLQCQQLVLLSACTAEFH